MKKFYRIIAFVLLTAMLSVLCVACCHDDEEKVMFVDDGEVDISIGIMTDVHVMSAAQVGDGTSPAFDIYATKGQKMLSLSEALLNTAVDEILESDIEYVLVAGDNTDDGGYVSHQAVAATFQKLENAGIKVYTIPGNHDLNNLSYTYSGETATLTRNTSAAEFASIYKNFGYDKDEVVEFYDSALNSDTVTDVSNLSYVADLDDEYRLIAIDMCNYEVNAYRDGTYGYVNGGRHDGDMTIELLEWVQAQTLAAVAAGKTPIGMMHFPLLQHFGATVEAIGAENSLVNNPDGVSVADTLASAGMEYIFTGHIHIQDIATYETEDDKVIYDVNTGCLCNYPTAMRYFRDLGDEVRIRTANLDRVDSKYIPDYISAEDKAALKDNFTEFTRKYVDGSMLSKVLNSIDIDTMSSLLGVFGIDTTTTAAQTLADDLYNDVLLAFFDMPVYKKQAKNGELSVEGICAKYGISLPSGNYTSVFNLAMSFATGLYAGDEVGTATSKQGILIKYALFSAIYMIADFDFFSKLHELNAEVVAVDLMPAMETLFKYGNLDVVQNGLISCLINSLDISFIEENFSGVKDSSSVNILSAVARLLPSFSELTFGVDVGAYISVSKSTNKGFIMLGAIIEEQLFGDLTIGLVNDFGPSDNNISVNKATLAWAQLN